MKSAAAKSALILSLTRQLDALILSSAHRDDIAEVRARLAAAKAAQ